jgi:hypothetical protein
VGLGRHPSILQRVREVEIGLVTERPDAAAAAIRRTLEEPQHDRERLNMADGKYVDFQLIRKFERYKRKWRYDDDLRFVLRVTTDGDAIDVDQLLRRLSAVEGEWRVLFDR